MQREINRTAPLMPSSAYKTYTVAAPIRTHWREVSCEEIACNKFVHGWITLVDERDPGGLAARQASYIRGDTTRSHVESRDESGCTQFHFGPGQKPFPPHETHFVKTDRPEIYRVTPGDHRGGTGVKTTHTRAVDWVEDFAIHQQTISDEIKKG
jgi:hypothetical protein